MFDPTFSCARQMNQLVLNENSKSLINYRPDTTKTLNWLLKTFQKANIIYSKTKK